VSFNQQGIFVRQAEVADAGDVVALFLEDGNNPYGWSVDKWCHYYRDYPEGAATSMVAIANGQVVGHYGLVPVKIAGYQCMLGMHAYVSRKQRGLTVLSALMKVLDEHCLANQIALICGFANKNFAFVKRKLFRWHTPLWLGFKSNLTPVDFEEKAKRKFRFDYTQEWYLWRFGRPKGIYLSRYKREGVSRKQVLCSRGAPTPEQLKGAEAWVPSSIYAEEATDKFTQPFSLKIYDKGLEKEGVLIPNNWAIDMADSDTFVYECWEA
jgi:hypothetical protein